MTGIYLDTNFFLYIAEEASPFFSSCLSLTEYCQKKRIAMFTSTETIQEIVHYSQRIRQQKRGVEIAKMAVSLNDDILSIDKTIIQSYLELFKKYPKIRSRDIIHVAICTNNDIKTIITYDKEFRQFSEIVSATPGEFLKQKKHHDA